jgi:uncharacterized OB-fold protein
MQSNEQLQKGFIYPTVDSDSRPWWGEIESGRFSLPICDSCKRRWFPPTPGCPHCGSTSVRIEGAGTHGTVYSWVVISRALNPAFIEDTPYTIVAVDLDAGARMIGRYLLHSETIRPDLRVNAEIYAVDGHRLVGFRPEPIC